MKPATCIIDFHGEELLLHPEGAIWWPATRSLLVSDIHLGKSAAFRAHGLPVPEGDNAKDLERIRSLVSGFDAATLLVLGDFLHTRQELTTELTSQINDWLGQLPCEAILIRGNHDPSAAKLAVIPQLETAEELRIGTILLIHDPAHAPLRQPAIAGHLHPLCRIGKKRGPSLRVPCFHRSDHCLILPAFGSFTSGKLIAPDPKTDIIYPIINRGVVEQTMPPSFHVS